MAYVPAQKTRLLVGDIALSGYAKEVKDQTTVDMLDATTFHDTTTFADTVSRVWLAGMDTSNLTVSGLYDATEHADVAPWKGSTDRAITYAPSGLALGSETWMVNGVLTSLELGASTSGLNTFDLTSQTDGLTDFGISLHDLITGETATSSSSAYNGTAASTNGGAGHLHVVAWSGLTSVAVIIEDSANGSTGWATIGTFTTATGLTSERITIAGTMRQYLRTTWTVVGTGSARFAVSAARR